MFTAGRGVKCVLARNCGVLSQLAGVLSSAYVAPCINGAHTLRVHVCTLSLWHMPRKRYTLGSPAVNLVTRAASNVPADWGEWELVGGRRVQMHRGTVRAAREVGMWQGECWGHGGPGWGLGRDPQLLATAVGRGSGIPCSHVLCSLVWALRPVGPSFSPLVFTFPFSARHIAGANLGKRSSEAEKS